MTLSTSNPIFKPTKNLPECDLPAIHLNGSGRENLLRQYIAAHHALNRFCAALASAECHARDYYPISDEAYSDARTTRRAVYDLCDEINAYLEDHIHHLSI